MTYSDPMDTCLLVLAKMDQLELLPHPHVNSAHGTAKESASQSILSQELSGEFHRADRSAQDLVEKTMIL